MSVDWKKYYGKKIINVFFDEFPRCENAEKYEIDSILTFEFDDKTFLNITPEGECCSSSWIEHICGVENLIDTCIVKVEEVSPDINDENIPENYRNDDCLQIYFYKFLTGKGHAQIDMRNLSNGYYGGELFEYVLPATKELKEDF